MKKHYHLNKKKFIRFVIVTILIIVAIVTVVNASVNEQKYTIVDYTTYTVKTGDTLWGIAKTINPGIDTRKVIYDIKNMNIWDGAPVIKAGDVISIPVYDVK